MAKTNLRSTDNTGEGLSELSAEMLDATVDACRKNYGRFPNVLGIGSGLKFVGGQVTETTACIHFYVSHKTPTLRSKARLPRFVYARTTDGTIDYSRRIPTDVISVGAAQLVRNAGTEILATGEAGTVTLVFRNLIPTDDSSYLLTCAHVVGDLTRSPPAHPMVRDRSGTDLAVTIANTVVDRGAVEYDIALARLLTEVTPQEALQIEGESTRLADFFPAARIRHGLSVACAFPISCVVRARVASSHRLDLPILVAGRECLVKNLFLIDRTVKKGDSGGLLYTDESAVGMLVAMSDQGLGLFQPLAEAVAFLQKISPVPIACFSAEKTKVRTS